MTRNGNEPDPEIDEREREGGRPVDEAPSTTEPVRQADRRETVIALQDVSFGYGEAPFVLDGASVEIPSGLTLLVGPNGCGKSTFMRLAAGVEFPDEGRVFVDGLDLWKDEAAARLRLAYVPEQPDLTPYASIREVMKLVARLRGEPSAAVDRVLEITGLARLGRRSVRALSLGQRRRVLLAAAMIGRPPVLLLDEPLEAMDRPMRELIVAWVLERCREGATAVVATHEFEGFESAAERALTIDSGAARLTDPLPSEPSERRSAIERLARGGADAPPAHDQAPLRREKDVAPEGEEGSTADDEDPRAEVDPGASLDGPQGDEKG